MPQAAILVIDVGTTVLKTGLFDFRCCPMARDSCAHGTEGLTPEEAASKLWHALKESVASVLRLQPRSHVAAVGLTGFMHYAFPLDARGRVLPLTASSPEVRRGFDDLLAHFGKERIYEVTGSRLDVTSVPAQVLGWRACGPGRFDEIAHLLPVKDLLRYRLTGEIATDEIDACGMMFYDIHRRRWDADIAGYCGIKLEALPAVRHCTERAGVVNAWAAAELGIPAGVPVAVGGGDDIEILGTGARSPRQACEHVGSTGSFLVSIPQPEEDPKRRLELYPAVTRNGWVLGGSCSNVARALDWFLAGSRYESGGSVAWDRARGDFAAAIGKDGADRPLFLPYLDGERTPLWDPDLNAEWVGLRRSHDACDLLASVVEGICFSLRHILECYGDLGREIDLVYSSGGFNEFGAQRLRASVYGKPIRLVRGVDPTAFATCAITLTSIGELSDPLQAADWLEFEPDVEPDLAWQVRLNERFERFVECSQRVTVLPDEPEAAVR